MAAKAAKGTTGRRAALTRERVIATAVRLADKEGVASLTMRKLAEKLGVEAMSLYHHVPDKEAILDGMVEFIFGEIALPEGFDWRSAIRSRANALRASLVRHPWAVALLDSRRNPGEATLRHQDWVLGTLRRSGFSVVLAAHAAALIDSYVYGFAIQEVALPFDTPEELKTLVETMLETLPADRYPNITEMGREVAGRPGYAFANEFPFGLELVLDGLERARAEGSSS
ncbi:MAG: TetR/AcrR family transcriptional regulator C-terminal domain-containing protein [Bauldia sp.]